MDAAAVLLLRGPEDPEVLLGRRAPPLPFLGGQWAFPGGTKLEADTRAARALGLSDPLKITALRELFEETGILLGHVDDPDTAQALRQAGPSAFAEAVEAGRLRLSHEQLLPAGRYLTPDYVPFRIDARYFLAWAPNDEPAALSGELVEATFLRPLEALDSWRRAERLLPSPVRVALSTLGRLPPRPQDPARYLEEAAEASERSRALDPIDCGDLGGSLVELFPGVALVPLRTPTLPPATHTNCTLFGSRELLAVDPASPYPSEQRLLDRVLEHLETRGARLVGVLLTHHHQDHIGGAAYLKNRAGVPVYAHRETAARVPTGLVDRLLEEGDVLELAGDPPRRVRALFTPGHAPGHLCYREETTGVTANGDMIASIGSILIDPSEGDMAEYLASLARLKASQPSFLIPAHGLVIGDPAGKVDEYVRHRLLREKKVLEALLAQPGPAEPGALLARAYDDTPPALYPLALRSLLAHLEKLMRDGLAARGADGRFSPARGA